MPLARWPCSMLSGVKRRPGLAWDGNELLNEGAGVAGASFQAVGAPGLSLYCLGELQIPHHLGPHYQA